MCGINGIFAYGPAAAGPTERELIATRDAMTARGPDGAGSWWSTDRRLAFGHRRLAILDPTPSGAQPMTCADGSFVITFNGEIYNHLELRRELEAGGRRFRSNSDTETLLALYEHSGVEMVHRLRGMYAFALWDDKAQRLFLARDVYGIKPLYFADTQGCFRFASQVKALLAGGEILRALDPGGVTGFFVWGSVPDPFTLYADIQALPAGASLIVDRNGARPGPQVATVAERFAHGCAEPVPAGEHASVLSAAMQDSVRAHLLADVDVGVFLSAGVDSSAILGVMHDLGVQRPKAITLGFEEFAETQEDEAPIAAEVAARYGADHRVRRVSRAEFEADLPRLLDAMDQPSIDGVNSWFVAKAAREAGLKVAISGMGGDEILAGYPSFRDVPSWVAKLSAPSRVPGLAASVRGLAKATGLNRRMPKVAGLLEWGGGWAGAYLLRRGLFLPNELETMLEPDFAAEGLRRLNLEARLEASLKPPINAPISRVAALESEHYLRHQLLRDADWSGMAHSVEIRTPLVDKVFLDTVAGITVGLSAPGAGKALLAATPRRPLPASVTGRAKTGFTVPIGAWLARATGASLERKGLASRAWARRVFDAAC